MPKPPINSPLVVDVVHAPSQSDKSDSCRMLWQFQRYDATRKLQLSTAAGPQKSSQEHPLSTSWHESFVRIALPIVWDFAKAGH